MKRTPPQQPRSFLKRLFWSPPAPTRLDLWFSYHHWPLHGLDELSGYLLGGHVCVRWHNGDLDARPIGGGYRHRGFQLYDSGVYDQSDNRWGTFLDYVRWHAARAKPGPFPTQALIGILSSGYMPDLSLTREEASEVAGIWQRRFEEAIDWGVDRYGVAGITYVPPGKGGNSFALNTVLHRLSADLTPLFESTAPTAGAS